MNKLGSFIKQCDIYGSPFNFFTYEKEKYQSYIGSILSLLTLGLVLGLFLVFGNNTFRKINPDIALETVHMPTFEQYPLYNDKFPIGLRIEFNTKSEIETDGYLYPVAQLNYHLKNLTTGNYYFSQKNYLPMERCSEDMFESATLFETMKGYHCLNWKKHNLSLGGMYDGDNPRIYYFKISLYYCKFDGKSFSNCTDFDKLTSLLIGQNKVFMSVMIPTVTVTPGVAYTPLRVSADNIFFTLNPLLTRTDRYYYSRVNIIQDVGWIFEDEYTFYGYKIRRRESDFILRSRKDYEDTKKSKLVGEVIFYIDNKIDRYQVNFIKIQTVAAQVGGIIKLFMMAFQIFSKYFNNHLRFFEIINDLFQYKYRELNNSMLKEMKFESKVVKVQNIGNPNSVVSLYRKDVAISKEASVNDNRSRMNYNYPSESRPMNDSSKMVKKSELFRRTICPCCLKSKKFENYLNSEKYLRQKLDITYYLKIITQFENLVKIILNPEQKVVLENISFGEKDNYINYQENYERSLQKIILNKEDEKNRKLLEILC